MKVDFIFTGVSSSKEKFPYTFYFVLPYDRIKLFSGDPEGLVPLLRDVSQEEGLDISDATPINGIPTEISGGKLEEFFGDYVEPLPESEFENLKQRFQREFTK